TATPPESRCGQSPNDFLGSWRNLLIIQLLATPPSERRVHSAISLRRLPEKGLPPLSRRPQGPIPPRLPRLRRPPSGPPPPGPPSTPGTPDKPSTDDRWHNATATAPRSGPGAPRLVRPPTTAPRLPGRCAKILRGRAARRAPHR